MRRRAARQPAAVAADINSARGAAIQLGAHQCISAELIYPMASGRDVEVLALSDDGDR